MVESIREWCRELVDDIDGSFSSTGSNFPTRTGPEPSVRFGETNFGPRLADTLAIRALIADFDSIWGSLVQFDTVGLETILRGISPMFDPAIDAGIADPRIEEWSRNVRQ